MLTVTADWSMASDVGETSDRPIACSAIWSSVNTACALIISTMNTSSQAGRIRPRWRSPAQNSRVHIERRRMSSMNRKPKPTEVRLITPVQRNPACVACSCTRIRSAFVSDSMPYTSIARPIVKPTTIDTAVKTA